MSTALSKSANQFAIDLFQCYLSRHGDKYRNLLLCPYLIYHSLAMMLVGANGNTEQQLLKLLRIPPLPDRKKAPGRRRSSSANSSNPSRSDATTTKERRPSRSPSLHSISSDSSLSSSSTHSSKSSLAEPIGIRPSPRLSRKASPSRLMASDTGSKEGFRRAGRASKSKGEKKGSMKSVITAEQSLGKSRKLTPDGPAEVRHREFLMLTEQLIHGNHDFAHPASFIYLDKGTKRTERFKAVLRDYYETKPKKVDFNNVDLTVKTINEDVARTTENIYNDILSKQEAQKLEKSYMLLVSAVFFRGFWLSNFTDVKKAPFIKWQPKDPKLPGRAASASQFDVNMMSKLDYLPVVSDEHLDARIVKMPFEASDLQMLLILPNNRQSDSTYLCQKISAAKINKIVQEFVNTKCKTVRVSMPVFCIDSGKISIQSTLVTMGASDLFDQEKANMSGVCENKKVWLHKILHRCFIICDNRGSITSSAFEKARKRQAQLDTGISTDPSETLEVVHESQLSPEEAHQIYTEGVYKT